MDEWEGLADWWIDELEADPIYALDVIPLALELLGDRRGVALELGCGDGQVMRAVAGRVVGTDISQQLLRRAAVQGPVVRGRLPDLDWVRDRITVEFDIDTNALVTADQSSDRPLIAILMTDGTQNGETRAANARIKSAILEYRSPSLSRETRDVTTGCTGVADPDGTEW